MEGEEEVESKPTESMKSHVAVRCAKAAILVASLKASPNRHLSADRQDQDEDEDEDEKEAMAREMRFLRTDLAREKLRSSKMKLCGLTEVVLQVLVVLSASTLLLLLVIAAGT